ncbi:MAG TPA: hypothetical protein VIU87_11230 [Mycobacterium sp.]
MLRASAIIIAAGIVTATLAAPGAAAAPTQLLADVPGMVHGVELSTGCTSWERYIFGRGDTGQTYACHYIPNQWPPVETGFWVWSPPLYGVQSIGSSCPDPGRAAAQSPDGLALECTESRGWQQDFYA